LIMSYSSIGALAKFMNFWVGTVDFCTIWFFIYYRVASSSLSLGIFFCVFASHFDSKFSERGFRIWRVGDRNTTATHECKIPQQLFSLSQKSAIIRLHGLCAGIIILCRGGNERADKEDLPLLPFLPLGGIRRRSHVLRTIFPSE